MVELVRSIDAVPDQRRTIGPVDVSEADGTGGFVFPGNRYTCWVVAGLAVVKQFMNNAVQALKESG